MIPRHKEVNENLARQSSSVGDWNKSPNTWNNIYKFNGDNYNMKLVYPVIISKEKSDIYYDVYIPDLEINTEG